MKKFLLLLMIFGVALFAVACNKEEAPHEHTFSEEWSSDDFNHWHGATCEHTDEKADFTGHFWGAGEVTTEPTCTAKGVRTFTCSTCGKTKTEEMKMLEHEWEYAVSEEDSTKHTISCANCDATKEVAEHKFEAKFDEEKHWEVCTDCGYIKDEEAHTYGEPVVAEATCNSKIITTYTCECTYSYSEESGELDPTNHAEEWDMEEGKWPCCDVEVYNPSVNEVMLDGHLSDAMWAAEGVKDQFVTLSHKDGIIVIKVWAVRNDKGIYFLVEYKTKNVLSSTDWWKSNNIELRIVDSTGQHLLNPDNGNGPQFWASTTDGTTGAAMTDYYITAPVAGTDGFSTIYFELFESYEDLGVEKDALLGFNMGSNNGGADFFHCTNVQAGLVWESTDLIKSYNITTSGVHHFHYNENTASTTVAGNCTTHGTVKLECSYCDEYMLYELPKDADNHTGEFKDGKWSCCGSLYETTKTLSNDYWNSLVAREVMDGSASWEVEFAFKNTRTAASENNWGFGWVSEVFSADRNDGGRNWYNGGWTFKGDWCGWGAWHDAGGVKYDTEVVNRPQSLWSGQYPTAAADLDVVMNIKFDIETKLITITVTYHSNVAPYSYADKVLVYTCRTDYNFNAGTAEAPAWEKRTHVGDMAIGLGTDHAQIDIYSFKVISGTKVA